MALLARPRLVLPVVLACCVPTVRAQDWTRPDPRPFKPARAQTKADRDRREARKLYGLAMLCQRGDQLVEATRLLEEAVTLDPDAATLQRALVPLYLALARSDDALAACDRALELDPDDFQTGYLRAQQLRLRGRAKEARDGLARALRSPGLADKPELRAQMQYDLGAWCEEAQEYDRAVRAFGEVVRILDNPTALLDAGSFDVENLAEQAANTYERMIKLCIQARQFDRALELFDRASKKHPTLRGRLNYSLAQLCVGQGKPEAALAHLDDYLRTQPQGTEAYELKISLLKQLGRAADIVPFLEAAAARDAQNTALQLLQAREYARAGRPGPAEAVYQAVAEKAPSPEVYRGLFSLYRDTRRGHVALNLLDDTLGKATKRDPKPGEAQAAAPSPAQLDEAAAKARAMLAVLREDAGLVQALLKEADTRLHGRIEMQPQTRHLLAALAARTHQLAQAERLYRSCFGPDGRLDPATEHVIYGGLLDVLWEARKYPDIVTVCEH